MGKKSFELHNYLDIKSSKNVIGELLEAIPDLEDIGYAGYIEKKFLEETLKRLILDKEENPPYFYKKENEAKIELICNNIVERCKKYIKEKIHIFLFPTFDKFAIEKMHGVSGFCPWENVIMVFINFQDKWKKYLEESIVHELAHALSPYSKPDASIGSWLILEGLAENFKEFILKGSKSSWVEVISEEEAWKIFKEIKNVLGENDFRKYSEIFFGSGKYPNWTGYTIGYYLVKKYLKDNQNIDWNILLRKNPQEILRSFR